MSKWVMHNKLLSLQYDMMSLLYQSLCWHNILDSSQYLISIVMSSWFEMRRVLSLNFSKHFNIYGNFIFNRFQGFLESCLILFHRHCVIILLLFCRRCRSSFLQLLLFLLWCRSFFGVVPYFLSFFIELFCLG